MPRLPRSMTAAEQSKYLSDFPSLNVALVVVTGEIDFAYNCIAWTLGFTNVWPWPGNSLTDFDNFYALIGHVRADEGPIAAYASRKVN